MKKSVTDVLILFHVRQCIFHVHYLMRSQISFLIKCLTTDSTYELRVPATTV